jgi:hypothetical protein
MLMDKLTRMKMVQDIWIQNDPTQDVYIHN